jgi:hypothetical protein
VLPKTLRSGFVYKPKLLNTFFSQNVTVARILYHVRSQNESSRLKNLQTLCLTPPGPDLVNIYEDVQCRSHLAFGLFSLEQPPFDGGGDRPCTMYNIPRAPSQEGEVIIKFAFWPRAFS